MWFTLGKGNWNFARVIQDKWRNMETTTGVCDCGYGCTRNTDMDVLWIWVWHVIGTGSGLCTGMDINF